MTDQTSCCVDDGLESVQELSVQQQWADYVYVQMEHKQIEKCNGLPVTKKICVKTAINA